MTALKTIITDAIRAQEPMNVADYMRLVLQHPDYGYYRHGDPLGRSGDFITAPEISQLFGEMIGLWCAEVWRDMGAPSPFVLLEMGPGRGTLMQDALRATAKIPGFHAAIRLCLLESSETLRAKQIEKLERYKPVYITSLDDLPPLPILTIANEFFDAMPVRQFEKTFDGWHERLVGLKDDTLAFTLAPPDESLARLVRPSLRDALPGAVAELSPMAVNFMHDLAKHIVTYGGAALVVDYGHAEPDGKPTLQAVKDHAYADVLAEPGEADLTALVDFGMLAQAAAGQGVNVTGPIGQGAFLLNMGAEFRADMLKRNASSEQAAAIDSGLHRLTDAAQMGVLFKAMAVTSSNLSHPPGFDV